MVEGSDEAGVGQRCPRLVLAERWRGYYNTQRPHSSPGYRPPAPAAWQTEASQGYGQVESKERFPLAHTSDYCDGQLSNSRLALH